MVTLRKNLKGVSSIREREWGSERVVAARDIRLKKGGNDYTDLNNKNEERRNISHRAKLQPSSTTDTAKHHYAGEIK